MNTKIIFKLKITKREAPTVQLVEEWLAEHLISYLMALLAKLEIRRLKNLEILRSVKQTLLFLLVNGGVDLRGDHTLLATGGETSDLKRQKYIEQIYWAIFNGVGLYIC